MEEDNRINELLKSQPEKLIQTEQLSLVNANAVQINLDANEFEDDNRFEIPTDETKLLKKEESIEQEINGPSFNSSITNNNLPNDLDSKLKSILRCHDRDYQPGIAQRGDFWVLKNYVRADHGELKCWESITYTTHADYSFLDNLPPLLER